MLKRILGITGVALLAQGAFAIDVTTTGDANQLVNTILGTGINVVPGTVQLLDGSGAAYSLNTAAGTFTGGMFSGIGIEKGIVLTSGNAGLIANTSTGITGNNGLPGYDPLQAEVPGYYTHDAIRLKFDFTTVGGDMYFNYVFGSDEYNEYANTSYNDVFAFFLTDPNGVTKNIALIPGTTTPVSVNNVNGGNPLYGTPAQNEQYYNNNDTTYGPPADLYPFEYDGFTDPFTAQALDLGPGTYTIELAIADSGDSILDSGVFIEAGSFSDQPKPPGTPECFGFATQHTNTAERCAKRGNPTSTADGVIASLNRGLLVPATQVGTFPLQFIGTFTEAR